MAGATSIKFGTDGWRSLVAEDFTLPNVRAVTQATAAYLKKHRIAGRPLKVMVGYDTRPLGDRFAEVVAEVFAGNGLKVLLTKGPMPTPAISFFIREMRLAGGVAVTASHNPFTYNGFKFKPFYAGPAEPEMTQWIEKRLFLEKVRSLPLAEGIRSGKIQMIDLAPRYLEFLKRYVEWPRIKKARFRVAYDSMFGAGQDLLQRVVAGSRLEILPIREGARLPSSHHRPEPIGEHLQELGAVVRSRRCHVGLATDGDADRLGLVGPDGRFVSSQETMALLLWHLLEDRKWRGLVATTVSATNVMEKLTAHYHVPLKRTPVGFKHIARLIRAGGVVFGGEESGGFGFKGCPPERDGLLAGLLVLEMMVMRKQNLGQILKQMRARFGHWIFKREDLALTRPVSMDEVLRWATEALRQNRRVAPGLQAAEISTADGAKVIFPDKSWFLLRPSGTEPLLRIYAEAKSEKQVQRLVQVGRQIGLKLIA